MLSALSCASEPAQVEWIIRFEDAGALAEETAAVAAWILRGGCSTTERVYEAEVSARASGPGPGLLRPGRYGFAAEALDRACQPIAFGCIERELPGEASAPFEIVLSEDRKPARCEPAQCARGRCGATSSRDGGQDARADSRDGGQDARADAGQSADAAPWQVPPDASDAAPDDAAPRGCADGVARSAGGCYRHYPEAHPFASARELCAEWSADADLVVFDDSAEERWVTANFTTADDFWLGITDAADEGVWLTVAGAEASYLNWDPQYAGGGMSANCARHDVERDAWRDVPCTNVYEVLCERP